MDAVAVIGALVALVWGLVILRYGGLLAGCLAVLLAVACFGVDYFCVRVGGIPLSIDRLLWLVLCGQYLVFRLFGKTEPKPFSAADAAVLALVGVMVFSTFTADWRAANYQPVAWLIIYYLMPFGVYWVARQTPWTERSAAMLFWCLAIFGVYLGATALAEYWQVWWLVYPQYIARTAAEARLEFIGRARGPLLNPIGNGLLLATCLAAALMLWPRLGRPRQAILLPVVLLMLAGVLLTLTRSAWLGGALVMALVIGLGMPRKWRLPLAAAGALSVLVAIGANWERLVSFKRDRYLTAEQTAESVQLRPILAAVAWRMFLDRPVFGCGYNQFLREAPKYLADRDSHLPLEKARGYINHNVLLAFLTETGLVGMGLFVALVALWARRAWLLWSDRSLPLWLRQTGLLMLACLVAYFANGTFHDVSAIPMANMMLFFLGGITVAAYGQARLHGTGAYVVSRGGCCQTAVPLPSSLASASFSVRCLLFCSVPTVVRSLASISARRSTSAGAGLCGPLAGTELWGPLAGAVR